ncbi:MAG TPA: hypothetical protein VD931_15445, partial [Baekduia sp.]|nr:hypothetical protein [Baekduia sp.]
MRHGRTAAAWLLVAPVVLLAVVRGPGLDVRHPLVALVALVPWAAAGAPLAVAGALLLRRRAAALAGAVAGAVLVAAVAGRALDGPTPSARGPQLVVMTSNLLG